ncbi:unnamed protein product [Cyprideis torosa]|uniref:Uncharacterized protein n=1 Tax=Cyprideis torosa TaxID=163714 RepID=A0A7R8WVR0_9CRUS|nr:unnamed protein product [Cyprideis torosa]CAG0909892.1 unnamed protein product [Cyprideis torosa]
MGDDSKAVEETSERKTSVGSSLLYAMGEVDDEKAYKPVEETSKKTSSSGVGSSLLFAMGDDNKTTEGTSERRTSVGSSLLYAMGGLMIDDSKSSKSVEKTSETKTSTSEVGSSLRFAMGDDTKTTEGTSERRTSVGSSLLYAMGEVDDEKAYKPVSARGRSWGEPEIRELRKVSRGGCDLYCLSVEDDRCIHLSCVVTPK